MADFLQPPRIDVHNQRIRQSQIRDKLRGLASNRPLLCDSLYERGELEHSGWNAIHIFKDDRHAMLSARGRGKLPADARPRKDLGYNMQSAGISRALRYEKEMSPESFQHAQFLTGELNGHVEPHQARVAAWQVVKVIEGEHRVGRYVDCRTTEK